MANYLLVGVVLFLLAQRGVELRLAARNRQWALAQGGKEYGAEHYPLFFLLHGSWFVGWVVEAFVRGPLLNAQWWLWLGLFAAAQWLRYWAISTLGPRWNTRILVIPGLAPVQSGPYRYLRHPNYIAVALELLVIPLIFNAWLTALLATLLNAALLRFIRIPAEEKALTGAFPPTANL